MVRVPTSLYRTEVFIFAAASDEPSWDFTDYQGASLALFLRIALGRVASDAQTVSSAAVAAIREDHFDMDGKRTEPSAGKDCGIRGDYALKSHGQG